MKRLCTLVLGTALMSSVSATEQSLETVPDAGYPIVQENADKALRVAYIVAGKTCRVGTSIGGHITSFPRRGDKQLYSAQIIIDIGEQRYYVTVVDTLTSDPDQLSVLVYEEKVPIETIVKARRAIGDINLMDIGLDGHINVGYTKGITSYEYIYTNLNDGRESGKEHEQHVQNLYQTALDEIIAVCVGK